MFQQLMDQCPKLASQEEYNTERFKIAQTNAASFRKQCQILEERNAKLNGIVAKHEQSSETMRAETMGLQSRLSQVRSIRIIWLKPGMGPVNPYHGFHGFAPDRNPRVGGHSLNGFCPLSLRRAR